MGRGEWWKRGGVADTLVWDTLAWDTLVWEPLGTRVHASVVLGRREAKYQRIHDNNVSINLISNNAKYTKKNSLSAKDTLAPKTQYIEMIVNVFFSK